ncbi:hypothetical protein CVT26_012659 [Gymnopilus dilepis]|uniref:Uncharacterized protein n=1 Tax=Gymnopilus dilepis TaxID=231916 RepID=A0A409YQ14_9AGAR|nr:hypothetical protein CVT26_012659 [Gymnopilus dilepis]
MPATTSIPRSRIKRTSFSRPTRARSCDNAKAKIQDKEGTIPVMPDDTKCNPFRATRAYTRDHVKAKIQDR